MPNLNELGALAALRTRHSVRAYRREPIPRDLLEQVVDCARLAATAGNAQPWEFVVVTDAATRRQLAEITSGGKFIADAAACVVVLCKDSKYFLEDGSAATQNLMVAATALGIGSCWVAGDKKPYADDLRRVAGAPDGLRVVSLVALGYPAEAEAPERAKRPLAEVLHWEKY